MRIQILVMLFIFVIGMAPSVEQLSRPESNAVILGSIGARNITNQTNIIDLRNVTGQLNITNQTQMNVSRLQRSFFQTDVNESRMETPSQANFQPALSRYDWSSLGK